MPHPSTYDVTYSYTGFEVAQGDGSFPGTQLDADLAGLESSIDELAAFVERTIRADNALNNGIVTYDSLAPSLQLAGLAPAVAWTTATSFLLGNAVVDSSNLYRCLIPHMSGVFATDLAAGKWAFVTAVETGPQGPAGTNGTNGADGAPGDQVNYNTKAAAAAATIVSVVVFVRTSGYAAAGDGGGALYKRVVSLLSGTIGFQSADGAWWQLADIDVRPQMAGAKNDVSADASPGIQAAVNHVIAVSFGRVLLSGRFILNSVISIAGRVTIKGDSKFYTILYPATAFNTISINTGEAVTLEDFSIQNSAPGSSSTITVTATASNVGSTFNRLFISNAYVGIQFLRAAYFHMFQCDISATSIAVAISNADNGDAGDSTIIDCLFIGTSSAVGVQWSSSGGLKMSNNKLIQFLIGFACYLEPGVNTTGLYFANNSIEGVVSSSFHFARQGTTGSVAAITIQGGDYGGGAFVNIPVDATGSWIVGLTVMGGAWIGPVEGAAVFSIASVSNFYIVGNVLTANGGTNYKAIIDASATNGEVGPNPGHGTFAASSNASGSTTLTRS